MGRWKWLRWWFIRMKRRRLCGVRWECRQRNLISPKFQFGEAASRLASVREDDASFLGLDRCKADFIGLATRRFGGRFDLILARFEACAVPIFDAVVSRRLHA